MIFATTLSNGQTTEVVAYATDTEAIGAWEGYCCGTCSLYFGDVQLGYFEASPARTACEFKASSGAVASYGLVAETPTEHSVATITFPPASVVTGADGFI